MSGTSTITANPFRFFDLSVVRAARLGPSVVRITFGGESLSAFAGGGRDQSLSLFLPQPGQPAPVLPAEDCDDWFAAWRAVDDGVRAVMRSYTVRESRREPDHEIDIDFVLHGDAGPASRWAARARVGDRVVVLGPAVPENSGVRFQPVPGTDWVLLAADETALPAVEGILAWLPAGTRAKVWIEVPHAEDARPLPTEADAEITWLPRDAPADRRRGLVEAVGAAELPAGSPYAWIAGEAGTVRALRRHLVGERGLDRRSVTFVGYWRRGASEEDLRNEAMAAAVAGDA
ncbi:siderophore-interacting protein [Allostreptomyces psammosilenae]|uniref:NADPH-dependent ferric siderophore reductase n=1 Tax=Allostreptomyces psammosilenae TaxID=1892865 RepID=A0A852ZU58_9ACTN|nr:siderophore-interacting protein [Allostreptomyces psammosilenae]NYI05097.1 NADPH-dependent ferric siderophore reductase [Allostreptomyces psammosilenae]